MDVLSAILPSITLRLPTCLCAQIVGTPWALPETQTLLGLADAHGCDTHIATLRHEGAFSGYQEQRT